MCGYISQVEDGWQSHIDEMKSSIRGINNSRNNANRIEGCDIDAELSDFDKRMIELIKSPAQGWCCAQNYCHTVSQIIGHTIPLLKPLIPILGLQRRRAEPVPGELQIHAANGM